MIAIRVVSLVLALCLADGFAGPRALAQESRRCSELPEAVANTREAILAGAQNSDFKALVKLIQPDSFAANAGDDVDPLDYWTQLKQQGTDVGPIMVALLNMPCAVYQGAEGQVYTWPDAADLPYQQLTKKEIAALQKLYSGKLKEQYVDGPETGEYAGWRLSINSDGTWSEFVAGD